MVSLDIEAVLVWELTQKTRDCKRYFALYVFAMSWKSICITIFYPLIVFDFKYVLQCPSAQQFLHFRGESDYNGLWSVYNQLKDLPCMPCIMSKHSLIAQMIARHSLKNTINYCQSNFNCHKQSHGQLVLKQLLALLH